ncbi:MAG: hypothetical protein ACKO2A_07185 [Acidimicrobiaceae bacterium]
MAKFTALDERFAHQIPEPFPNVLHFHPDWRESLFFIMHEREKPGDVLILTLAHFPSRQEMDSLQLGRVGESPIMARHMRKVDGDQDNFQVGPITIDVVEPLKKVRLIAAPSAQTPVSFDITFTARTAPYQLRRGTMKAKYEVIWDQSHMFQSGIYNGSYTFQDKKFQINNWWGQRDHSWGVRAHARCPLWMGMPIQLEEGMLSVWHWEYPNGARVYTDGCFAPSNGSEPIPVIDFQHDLYWLNSSGQPVSYEKFGDDVVGLAGTVVFTLQGGRKISVEATGRWAQRYSQIANRADNVLGGGLSEMQVKTSDGATGTAIFEITGQFHHKYFPIARGTSFPPDGA